MGRYSTLREKVEYEKVGGKGKKGPSQPREPRYTARAKSSASFAADTALASAAADSPEKKAFFTTQNKRISRSKNACSHTPAIVV
jgi:hypothetical protein